MKKSSWAANALLTTVLIAALAVFGTACSDGGDDNNNNDEDGVEEEVETDADASETIAEEAELVETADETAEGDAEEIVKQCKMADPECAEDKDCGDGKKCVNGACAAASSAETYKVSDNMSFLSRLQIPTELGFDSKQGFDMNDDGEPDDRLGQIIKLIHVTYPSLTFDMTPLFEDAINRGLTNYLFEFHDVPTDMCGPAKLAFLEGGGDENEDGVPDQTFEQRLNGGGVFQMTRLNFETGYGPKNQLNRAFVGAGTDGTASLHVEGGNINYKLVLPGDVTVDLNIQNFTIETQLEPTDGSGAGFKTIDFKPIKPFLFNSTIDSDDAYNGMIGGARVGGYIPLDSVVQQIDAYARPCGCLGFDPNKIVADFKINESQMFEGECVQPAPDSQQKCTYEEDGFFCYNMTFVCSFISFFGSLADVSTGQHGAGVKDAMSIALFASMTQGKVNPTQPVTKELTAANDFYIVPLSATKLRLNVLSNDSNSTKEGPSIYSVGTPNKGGTVSINADKKSLMYTPKTGFKGYESFTYKIGDALKNKQATVQTTVGYMEPQTEDDVYEVPFNRGAATLQVLLNDRWDRYWHDTYFPKSPVEVLISRPQSDTLGVASKGQVEISTDKQKVVYTPPPYDANLKEDQFRYYFTDGFIKYDGSREQSTKSRVLIKLTVPSTACHDGYYDSWAEECDDGNDDDNDACLSNCIKAKCGDSIVQTGVEECDDGNADDNDYCTTQCKFATCFDGIKDQDETGIDCGGTICKPCANDKACLKAEDCLSLICDNNVCKATACSNGQKDVNETDVDCGGACQPCADGKNCTNNDECLSANCGNGKCIADQCANKWVSWRNFPGNAEGWNNSCKGNPCARQEIETTGNAYDEDCDGWASDMDDDGWCVTGDAYCETAKQGDCEDFNPETRPGAQEIPGNLFDENCDGVLLDKDNDGHIAPADCVNAISAGITLACDDCDDSNSEVYPGSTHPESILDSEYYRVDGSRMAKFCDDFAANKILQTAARIFKDYNCDGYISDMDGDGWCAIGDTACAWDKAWDCNDFDPRVHPVAASQNPYLPPDCNPIMPLINDTECPTLDFAQLGFFKDGLSCPGAIDGQRLLCRDLVDQYNVSWGIYICVPGNSHFQNPLAPLSFTEKWGPCDFGQNLPQCGADLFCAGPIIYTAQYKQLLKDNGYDVSTSEDLGMCFPKCGDVCTLNPCKEPNKNVCKVVSRQPSCSCNPGYVLVDGTCQLQR